MTTETKTRLEELLEKANGMRKAEMELRLAGDEAARARRERNLAENIAVVRGIVEPVLGACDITPSRDPLYLDVTPRVWKGLVRFIARPERGVVWKLIHANAGECLLDSPDGWEGIEALAFLDGLDEWFRKMLVGQIGGMRIRLTAAVNAEAIMNALADLMTFAPERVDEWDALAAEVSERINARAAAVDAYVEALTQWRAEYEATLAANRAALSEIQTTFDNNEFTRREVCYTAVGVDGSSEAARRRETAWAFGDVDVQGYWSLFEDGGTVRRRIPGLLWLGEPITQRLSEAGPGPWWVAVFSWETGQPVYCLPWDRQRAFAALDERILPLPVEPSPPEFFSDGLTADERKRINEVTNGMARVDIPF
jgi:hypothetical protein